ncbi:hypothetical protein WDV93_01400 [Pantoea ananatis]
MAPWSLALPSALLQTLPDGNWPVAVTMTDTNGNTATINSNIVVAIQTLPDVSLTLPFGDGALNAAEAAQDQTLTGSTGISGEGQTVTVTISGFNNDLPLNATVLPDGSWSLVLTPAQMAQIPNGSHVITVNATDIARQHWTALRSMWSPPSPFPCPPLLTCSLVVITC